MKKSVLLLACGLFLSIAAASMAASPFPAPASFDLEGSSVTLAVELTTRVRTVQMGLSPNPAPVSGTIVVNQLNQVSGEFSGSFNGISASTTATISEPVSLSVPVSFALDSGNVTGVFAWAKDKVVFDLNQLTATLTVGGQSYPIPLYGTYVPASYSDGMLSLQAEVSQTGEYMGYQFSFQATINIVGHLQASGGALWIELATDRTAYAVGDSVKLSAAVGKSGTVPALDLYLVLCAPDGQCYFAPGFTTAPVALISGWQPDQDFYMPPVTVFDIPTPAALPPVGAVGNYQFVAAFFAAGTFDLVGEVSVAPFSLAQSVPQSHDGIWRGEAVSLVNTPDCTGFADVRFEIVDSRISGEANEIKDVDADGYLVTGAVTPDGRIEGGTILEELALDLVPVGFFDGTFAGDSLSGTWQDVYGCYGTYTLTRSNE